VLDHRCRGDVQGAWHVTGAQPGARLRRLSQKALRGARIDYLCRAARQGCAHGGERGHEIGVLARSEGARGALDRTGFERPPFGFPFRQTAVENEDVLRAEQAKRPPHPRRGIQTGAVVDDDCVGVGDAKRPHVTANWVASGSMCGSGLEWSAIASTPKRTAPGMWPARYSAAASRCMVAR